MPYPYTLKDARDWIKRNKEKWRKKPVEDYAWGTELKTEPGIFGGIGIHHVDRYEGSGEIGYWLGARHHGNGYGTEALRAVVDFAFNRLKLRRLEAGVFDGNPSSGRLLEKLGFRHEGLKVKAKRAKSTGEIHDEHLYGLLREEYSHKV